MRTGNGQTRLLFGLLIVAALVVALILAQRGILDFTPREIAQPLPPPATELEPAYSRPIFVEPVPLREPQTSMASEPAIETATPKSRPKPRRVNDKPKHTSTPPLVAEPASRAPEPHVDPCDQMVGKDLAWCMRPQILDADRQLRTAYSEAVQAGVEKRQLVAYRRQWSKLRKRANSDPRRVLVGYREIAQQLDAARTARLTENSGCPGGVCAAPDDR